MTQLWHNSRDSNLSVSLGGLRTKKRKSHDATTRNSTGALLFFNSKSVPSVTTKGTTVHWISVVAREKKTQFVKGNLRMLSKVRAKNSAVCWLLFDFHVCTCNCQQCQFDSVACFHKMLTSVNCSLQVCWELETQFCLFSLQGALICLQSQPCQHGYELLWILPNQMMVATGMHIQKQHLICRLSVAASFACNRCGKHASAKFQQRENWIN